MDVKTWIAFIVCCFAAAANIVMLIMNLRTQGEEKKRLKKADKLLEEIQALRKAWAHKLEEIEDLQAQLKSMIYYLEHNTRISLAEPITLDGTFKLISIDEFDRLFGGETGNDER